MTASESIGACAMDQRSQAPAVSRRRPYAALVAIAAVGHTPHTCNAFTASTGRTGVSVWTAHAARQRQGWAAGAQGTLLRTSTAPHFDTVAEYTESILACEQKGEAGFDLAYGLYLELKPADGPKPDAELFAAVLRLCAAAHRWEHALDVLKDMQQAGVSADEDCYASALKACKRAGRCQDAVALLVQMHADGVRPNAFHYHAALRALRSNGRWSEALELLRAMQPQYGVRPNAHCYNTVMQACDSARQPSAALEVLQEMRDSGVAPNVFSYNAVMRACERVADWQYTLALYEVSRQHRNHVVFSKTPSIDCELCYHCF
jgi:pentatricopeptide repeat protein